MSQMSLESRLDFVLTLRTIRGRRSDHFTVVISDPHSEEYLVTEVSHSLTGALCAAAVKLAEKSFFLGKAEVSAKSRATSVRPATPAKAKSAAKKVRRK